MLRLDSEVLLNQYIQPACLPLHKPSTYPTPTANATVAGWGSLLDAKEIYPSRLRNVQLSIYPSDACYDVMPQLAQNWNSQICAGK